LILPEEENLSEETAKELSNKLLDVFKNRESLTFSFFQGGDLKKEIDDIDHWIDFPFIANILELVGKIDKSLKQEPTLIKKVRDSIERHLDDLRDDIKKNKLKHPAQVRLLGIVVGIPLLFEFEYSSVLRSYIKACNTLSPKYVVVLTNWFTSLTKTHMSNVVEALSNTISI